MEFSITILFYNSTTAGIGGTTTPGSSTFNFYSNIISTCSGNASLTNSVWDYNCFYNAGTVPAGGVGNITTDPLMTNPAGGNYTLQGGSPCINTGHPAVLYTDIDKTRNDMGAYGSSYTLANFASGTNPKIISIQLSPTTVIQGNTLIINAKGIGE